MNKIKILALLLFIGFTFGLQINAQNVPKLEDLYIHYNNKLTNEVSKLDTLKKDLYAQVNIINTEKEKGKPNKEKIKSLMASSVVISNKVDKQQKIVNNLKDEIELLKKKLMEKYSVIIDSLNTILKSNKNIKDKEKLKPEIFYYTEKRLKLYPGIKLLSFFPNKILQIDLSKITDTTEKKLYKEYLQKALSEVNDRLMSVTGQSNEIVRMITLQKKTKRFLEETEFGNSIMPGSFTSQTTTLSAKTTPMTNLFSKARDALNVSLLTKVRDYTLLLNQLDINEITNSKLKWQLVINPKNKHLDLQQYQELLLEVKKRLKDYKIVLMHKLGKN